MKLKPTKYVGHGGKWGVRTLMQYGEGDGEGDGKYSR